MAGSSTYPTSVDNKTALVDGLDYMEADNINNSYVPINKTQTFIGANGKGASWSTDILELLANAGAPVCTKKDVDEIYVSAGAILIKNSGQANRLMRRNTSVTTVTAADIDTGSLADDTYYYLYAVADTAATTFTVKFSLSASAPTGLTNFELIGWFFNQSAGALDITLPYVGNVKANGRDVPNVLVITSTTQVSTASASLVDDTQATARFYSNGRPVLIRYNGAAGFGSSDRLVLGISVDASDVTSSPRKSPQGATVTTDIYGVESTIIQTLSVGTHTIQGRYYTTAGTGYINSRELQIIEL